MTDPTFQPTCPSCAQAARKPVHGGYRMDCMYCCARLLATTRPQSRQAQAMLAVVERAIGRWKPSFGLAEVKACARLIRTKRRSVGQKSGSPSTGD